MRLPPPSSEEDNEIQIALIEAVNYSSLLNDTMSEICWKFRNTMPPETESEEEALFKRTATLIRNNLPVEIRNRLKTAAMTIAFFIAVHDYFSPKNIAWFRGSLHTFYYMPQPAPTTQQENNMNSGKHPLIATHTFVNGTRSDELSNEEIFEAIRTAETEVTSLESIQNKPKALQKKIDGIKESIQALVALVDSRSA